MSHRPPAFARFLRCAARGVLTLYALTSVLVALTIAFPAWGRDPNSSAILYFPPQACDYVRHAGRLPIPLEQQAIAAISSLIAFAALPALALRYRRPAANP